MISPIVRLFFLLTFYLMFDQLAFAQCGACTYQSENLVVNGDFSIGNLGFTTDYAQATTNGPWGLLSFEGQYAIDNNANDVHQFFAGFDHTNPPTGLYMIVNGSGVANTNVWCQTITVQPDTWYSFSAWVRNVDTNPDNNVYAQLQFNIDGVPLGPSETVSGGWQQIAEDWYSGTSTSIDICLVNQQTNGGGNDFGLDDITFTTCIPYELVNVPTAGEDQVICSGETVQLGDALLTDYSYLWTGEQIDGATTSAPEVLLVNDSDAPLDFTFILESDSADVGCLIQDEVTITVNPLPNVPDGEDVVVCEGEEATLDVGAGWDTILWSNDSTTQTITVSEAGSYDVEVSLLGCTNETSWSLINPDLPDVNLGPDTSICVDETFTFSTPELGVWNDGSTDNSLTTDQEGWYWFEVEELGCTQRDSVFLSVIEYPLLQLPDSVSICPSETVTFYAPQVGFWTNGVTADSLVVGQEGTYGVVVNNAQCAVYDEVLVVERELPFVELGEDQILCLRDVVRLDATGAYNDTIQWNDAFDMPIRDVTETGYYEVTVANECGSMTDDIELIFEDCDYAVYLPNAFTPDGDGLNENWCPVLWNIDSFLVQVFNRWGEMIWQSTDQNACWIGDVNGGGYYAPDGVYAYRMVAESDQGKQIVKDGYITLIR